eukprot:356730-Chlamydomonas_euryale.AAC.3
MAAGIAGGLADGRTAGSEDSDEAGVKAGNETACPNCGEAGGDARSGAGQGRRSCDKYAYVVATSYKDAPRSGRGFRKARARLLAYHLHVVGPACCVTWQQTELSNVSCRMCSYGCVTKRRRYPAAAVAVLPLCLWTPNRPATPASSVVHTRTESVLRPCRRGRLAHTRTESVQLPAAEAGWPTHGKLMCGQCSSIDSRDSRDVSRPTDQTTFGVLCPSRCTVSK